MVTLWALAASIASAAQVQIVVEPTSLVQGQTGSARVIVVLDGRDVVDTRRPPPLPTSSGLRADYVGQATNVQRIGFGVRGGSITRVVQFEYQLVAGAPGKWTVGPVDLSLPSGEKVHADPVPVTVTERSEAEASDLRFEARIRSARTGDQEPGKAPAPRAWEGEVVTFEREVATRYGGVRVQWGDTQLEGLRQVHLGQPEERRYRVDDPNGALDVVKAIYPLVATGLGHHDLGPSTVSVLLPSRDGSLFGRHTEVLMSDPVTVDVDPLPPAPPGFDGLVGDFTLTSTLDPAGKVKTGASLPWTLVLTGDGSLEGVKLPDYEVPGVSIYDSNPKIDAGLQGDGFVSTATFSRVLVPTQPGDLTLPDLDLVTFSPSKGAYEHLHVQLPTLHVQAGAEEEQPTVTAFGSPPEAAPEDPSVPRPPYAWGRDSAPSLRAVLVPALALAALPGLVVLGLDLLRSAMARARARRREERAPTAAELLAQLPEDEAERLAVLDHALRMCEAASDAAEVRALRQRLGKVRFGGGPPDPTLEEDLRRLVLRVEREAA